MGQSLVIRTVTGYDNENRIASAYYHWSGYTEDAIELVSKSVSGLEDYYNTEEPKEVDNLLKSLYMFSSTGAGFNDGIDWSAEERAIIRDKYPLFGCNVSDKNSGLIAISEKEQQMFDDVCEYLVEINLDTGSVDLSGAFHEYGDEEKEGVTKLNYNLHEIQFTEWDSFTYDFERKDGKYFLDSNDRYYEKVY